MEPEEGIVKSIDWAGVGEGSKQGSPAPFSMPTDSNPYPKAALLWAQSYNSSA